MVQRRAFSSRPTKHSKWQKTSHAVIVISTEKYFGHPYSLYSYFLAQIRGPKVNCVTHSTVVPSLRNTELLSQLNILGELWRSWLGLERLFKPEVLSCMPFWINQEKLWLKSEIQVNAFSPISLLQSFYILEHQHSKRQGVLIICARLSTHLLTVRFPPQILPSKICFYMGFLIFETELPCLNNMNVRE